MNATTPGYSVSAADFAADHEALRAVREAVFVREQGVPPELEADAQDPECLHVLARDAAGRPIGTGRLTPAHTLGRMAVLPEWRGRGVFRRLYDDIRREVESTPSLRGLRLYDERNNANAQKAYQAMGMSDEHYTMFEWLK